MKPNPKYMGVIAWVDALGAERTAERMRIEAALDAGCREFTHRSMHAVAIVTPAQHSTRKVPVLRVTKFDEQGPYGHCEVTGGATDNPRGLDLIATRLQDEGFVHPRVGALDEVYCP